MKIYLFIIQIIFLNQVFSQSTENNKRGPCGEITGYLFVINGIVFSPKTQADNKPESSIRFCDGTTQIYYLEGLQLTEKKFIEIGIKPKDCLGKKTEYAYQFRNNDTTNCVEFTNLFVSVSVPIRLNGVKLKNEEREKQLRNLSSKKIFYITRKKSFFGKGGIEITTS